MVAFHGAVDLHYRRRGLLPWERSRIGGTRCFVAGSRLSRASAQAGSLSQRRSGHDEPVSARRGLCHRRRGGDRSRSRPLRALHRCFLGPVRQCDRRAHLPDGDLEGASWRLSRPHRAGDPHVTDAIKEFVMAGTDDLDFLLCEIGGTVGDIEGLPFFEAIRQLGNDLGRDQAAFVHLTLVPYIEAAGELKTKPTQHSVKELRAIGIQPDILLCRASHPVPDDERRKIALFCNVRTECVIPALDMPTIYDAPVRYHDAGFDTQVLNVFGIKDAPQPDLSKWKEVVERVTNPEGEVRIAVVGKYIQVKDSYKSLSEALTHGGLANNVKVHMDWIDSEIFERDD